MISFGKAIKGSSSKTSDYYMKEEKDLNLASETLMVPSASNYYLSEQEKETQNTKQWFGKLAEKEGIAGQTISEKEFTNMLNGIVGERQVHGAGGETRRQGYDLTFSAPKGASILALAYGDNRISSAFEEAVKITLSAIEKDTAQTRVYDKNTKLSTYENTKNLLFGLIKHQTSRENEPQLHIHAVMANLTENGQGELQSLGTAQNKNNVLNGTFERIMENQKYYTAMMHSELGQKLVELGYDIKSVDNGQIDIAGIPQSVLDANSTRSQQIKAHAKEQGMDSQAAKDVAALTTRKPKEEHSSDTLNQQWRKKNQALGFDGMAFVAKSHEPQHEVSLSHTAPMATVALEAATKHISDNHANFSMEKLVSTAITEFSQGQVLKIGDVKNLIDWQVRSGGLIPVNEEKTRFTTITSIKKEHVMLEATQGAKRKLSIAPNQSALEQLALSKANKKTITGVMESHKTVNMINLRHAPKQVSEALLHVASNSGQTVRFITPDTFSRKENQEQVQRQSHTPLQWLKNVVKSDHVYTASTFLNQEKSLGKGNLLVVEHANKLGVEQTTQLINTAKETNNKIVFLNQEHGSKSMGSDTMSLLKKGNIEQHAFVNTKRQSTHVNITQTDNAARLEYVAAHYVEKTPIERETMHVAAHSKSDVNTLNRTIRDKLDRQGELGEKRIEVTTLQPVFLTKEQKQQASNYKTGHIITEFSKGKPPTSHEITSIDKKANTVTIMNDKGKEKQVSALKLASKNISLSTPETLELAQNDKLRVGAAINGSDLTSHDTLTVSSINRHGVTFVDGNNKKHTLSDNQLGGAPLQYNYATSLNQIPTGKDNVIISAPSYVASKEMLGDMIDKEAGTLTLVVDDEKKVRANIEKSKVQPSRIEQVLAVTGYQDKYLNSTTHQSLQNDTQVALQRLLGQTNQSTLDKSVNYAIALLSEKDAAFTHQDLVKTTIEYAMKEHGKPVTERDITTQLNALKKEGALLSAEYDDGTRWVTKTALETEKSLLAHIEQGKNTLPPLVDLKTAEAFSETNQTLTTGQKDAIILITTTPDRFVAVQGLAGTGKSTMLEQGIELVQHAQSMIKETPNQSTQFIGLAPTHAAVSELKEKGVPAQTSQSVLFEYNKNGTNPNHKNTVFLFDESSMNSNEQMAQFTQMISETEGARAVFLGDRSQLQSISAGKPFQLAIERGVIDTSIMKDIVRQQNAPLLSAVQQIVDKDAHQTIKHLKGQTPLSKNQYQQDMPSLLKDEQANINQSQHVISTDSPYKEAAEDYLSRTQETKDNTLIIAYTNKERDHLAELIRPGLQQQGELHSKDIPVSRLRSLGIKQEKMATIMPYQTGLVLTKLDSHYLVGNVDTESKSVELIDTKTGESTAFFPEYADNKYNQLWQKETLPLAIGDKILWRQTDKERGIIGNEAFNVTSINENKMTIESIDSGKTHTMQHDKLEDTHWDYRYTRTANMAQGATYKNVISVIDATARLTDIRRGYIDISRASEHAKIFTNSETKLINAWLHQNNDKVSALDTLEKTDIKHEKQFEPEHKTNPAFQEDGQFKLSKYGKHLANELTSYTESLTKQLLGKENIAQSSQDYLVFNQDNGQTKVSLTGEYRGYYRNYITGERGNLINLIMNTKAMSYTDAVEHAKELIDAPEKHQLDRTDNAQQLSETLPKRVAQQSEFAANYYAQSTPIKDTIAAHYLDKNEHKNPDLLSHENLRFHPSVYSSETQNEHPAMIAKLEDNDGNFKAIEITYLTDKGNVDHELNINQRVLGQKTGNKIVINEPNNPRHTFIIANTDTAISLSNEHKDANIYAVNKNNDLRNLTTEEIKTDITLILNKNEISPSNNFINELQQKLGGNLEIIQPNEHELPSSIEEIKNKASDLLNEIDEKNKLPQHDDIKENEIINNEKELKDHPINDNNIEDTPQLKETNRLKSENDLNILSEEYKPQEGNNRHKNNDLNTEITNKEAQRITERHAIDDLSI